MHNYDENGVGSGTWPTGVLPVELDLDRSRWWTLEEDNQHDATQTTTSAQAVVTLVRSKKIVVQWLRSLVRIFAVS